MNYKEKLEEAKRLYEIANPDQKYVLESLFPELSESEDEKIRKALINQFSDYKRRGENHGFGYSNDKILAWLEKQAEQKSLDDVAKEITKTKETAISFLKSCGIMNANGELADEYKIEQDEQKSEEVDNLHNYLYGEQKPDKWEPQTGDTFRKKGTTSPTYHLCNKREDGITFGFVENREVGISGGELTIWQLKDEYELVERSKSIEDAVEEELNKCFQTEVGKNPADNIESSAFKDKLLELFQRFRWYCKDEAPTNGDIVDYVDAHIQELIDTIKNVSTAWSEEDKSRIITICTYLQDYARLSGSELRTIRINEYCDWLKSLKEKYTWKPSEGQLECLRYAIENAEKDWSPLTNNKIYLTLKALKEQLEKL